MAKDYFEFKLPKFKGFGKVKNPWIISTITLFTILVAGVVLFSVFYLGNTPATGAVSSQQAGQNLVDFLNANTNVTVALQNTSEISGIYQVDIQYQNQTIPLYTTTDGKFFIQSLIPLQ